MEERPKPDPAIYRKLRERALGPQPPRIANEPVQIVLMDWNVANGTATVLAAMDGTASLYLSSGGGFIGGGQKYPAIREAALHAIRIATSALPLFKPAVAIDLPTEGDIYFYINTNAGLLHAIATNEELRARTDLLGPLAAAMQDVVTQYRLKFSKQTSQGEPAQMP